MTTTELPPVATPRVKRWTKDEYNQRVERGLFQGMRLYLFRGELIEMPPMGAQHARCIMNVANWLYEAFRPDFEIRIQMPFETPGQSMPEPDAAVVDRKSLEHQPHPSRALLVIEVADSSLDLDREKAFDYAAAGVAEYWIINVGDRSVTVFTKPVPDVSASLGYRYVSATVLREPAIVTPVLRPEAGISVGALLAMK